MCVTKTSSPPKKDRLKRTCTIVPISKNHNNIFIIIILIIINLFYVQKNKKQNGYMKNRIPTCERLKLAERLQSVAGTWWLWRCGCSRGRTATVAVVAGATMRVTEITGGGTAAGAWTVDVVRRPPPHDDGT